MKTSRIAKDKIHQDYDDDDDDDDDGDYGERSA